MSIIRIDNLHLHIDIDALGVLSEVTHKLDTLMADEERRYDSMIERTVKMAASLDDVAREIEENDDAIDSAVELLATLSNQIEELKNDPVALQALADQLDANSKKLADAVVANTPVNPTPPTPPIP